MRAVRIHENGGPEVLKVEDLPTPTHSPGEARIRIEFSGVNFIDRNQRRRHCGPFPMPIGHEGAGTVEALDPNPEGVRVGDCVGWILRPGTYATHAIVPIADLIPIPDDLGAEIAAAVLLQGLTAHHLARSTYALGPSDTCLIHGAAGGVAGMITQIAKILGARVIATVSSVAKARTARELGADEVILYTERDFAEEVRRLTGGRGVDVVYDGVGGPTFERDLDCVRPRGLIAVYGAAGGEPPALATTELSAKGSLYVTQTHMRHYLASRDERLGRANEIFAWLRAGTLRTNIGRRLALGEARTAHEALEDRGTIGKLLLVTS